MKDLIEMILIGLVAFLFALISLELASYVIKLFVV